MNTYRNLHYMVENECKRLYKKTMSEQITGVVFTNPVTITYQVFKGSATVLDKMNVISIVSKYLLDALVELGALEDDSDTFVKLETILPTETDKENPRVEVTVKELVFD